MDLKTTCIIGIDPGLTGGVCIMTDLDQSQPTVQVFGTPVYTEKKNKRNVKNFDIEQMAEIFRPYQKLDVLVNLEKVHAFRGQGVTSMFNFGRGFGLWEGIFAGLNFPIEYVTPQTWKKQWADELLVTNPKPDILKLKPAEYNKLPPKKKVEHGKIEEEWKKKKKNLKNEAKDAARHLAMKLYPKLKDEFKLKKDDGKAEALLIAERKRLEIING